VDLIKYLRWRTYMLASRQEDQRGVAPLFIGQPPQETAFTPVNVPADALAAETAALPPDQLLVQADSYRVYFARAPQIPNLLQEIGRQREITFREVGEGTGREIDLDRYDDYYLHLFVWNQATSEVVGGYRLGFTDLIRNRHGIKGLYTHSLFRYGPRFYHRINPAIELGRSFVKPEYQKSYHALMLLWKGIGRLVARSPKYKILFGPVSITSDYDDTSRHLIAAFFKENTRQDQLARLVKPRTPLRRPEMQGREFRASLNFLQDIKALSDFISEIEDDEKGIPILLKQYLKLGGRSLAFNVDPAFSNALDSLIVVDLTKTDKRILERYMGKEDALAFRRHHGLEPIAHCA
jgi:putative hemolysin